MELFDDVTKNMSNGRKVNGKNNLQYDQNGRQMQKGQGPSGEAQANYQAQYQLPGGSLNYGQMMHPNLGHAKNPKRGQERVPTERQDQGPPSMYISPDQLAGRGSAGPTTMRQLATRAMDYAKQATTKLFSPEPDNSIATEGGNADLLLNHYETDMK